MDRAGVSLQSPLAYEGFGTHKEIYILQMRVGDCLHRYKVAQILQLYKTFWFFQRLDDRVIAPLKTLVTTTCMQS